MSYNSQITPSAPDFNLVSELMDVKSDAALKASLQKLQALLEMVAEVQETGESSAPANEESMANNVLAKLGPILNAYMSTDPVKAQQLLKELAPLLTQYGSRDQAAIEKIVNALAPAVRNFLLKNPNGFMDVIQLTAPLVQANSTRVKEQIGLAKTAFLDYEEAVQGVSSEEFQQVFTNIIAPALAHTGQSTKALEGIYQQIKPTLEKLYAKNPSKMQDFLNRLTPILGMIALRNPEKASELVADINLEELYEASDEQCSAILQGTLAASGTPTSPDLSGGLGTAMLFLQQFQVSISQAQADQDKINALISQALIYSAQQSQIQIDQKVAKSEEEQRKAAHRPWWEKLIMAFVAVISIIVAAFSGGLGAALTALVIGAFMSSPLFNMTIQAIASSIATILQKEYIAEGMSPQDAQQKAQAVANIIAKIVVMIAVMVVSCGLGGISAASEGAANTAMDEGIELMDMAGGDAVDAGASSASKYSYSLANGLKMGLFEGVATLTASNIWMDMMMTNPEWIKEHQTLSLVLDIIAEIVGAIATFAMGAKCLAGMSGAGNLLETIPGQLKGLIPLSWVAEAGQGVMEATLGAQRAAYLGESATTTKLVGELEAELTRMNAAIEGMTESQTINDTSASNISKGVAQEMNALGQSSGAMWDATTKVLLT